jgi:hypothetical protein
VFVACATEVATLPCGVMVCIGTALAEVLLLPSCPY